MALAGAGTWEVTVAAPSRLRGDLRTIALESIQHEQCTVVPLEVRLAGYPHWRFYSRAIRPLLRQPWDVVHCWEEPYVVAAGQVARHVPAASRFVPATFQNLAKLYPFPIASIERRVMARADAWIAFGETVHETHRDRKEYAVKPSRVINPGVDLATFRPDPSARRAMRARLGWDTHHAVVGFTGRFVEEKGIGTLLEAFAESTLPWNLLFVGGGRMQPLIDTLRLRHPSRVRAVTGVSHDDIPGYLNAMDLLCAPSRTTARWREQFGRMLIEAMACGVPIAASSSGEIPHVVGDAGVLIAEDNPPAWREAIERLLTDDALRDDYAARGLARARARFDWQVVARAHLDFFDQLCER